MIRMKNIFLNEEHYAVKIRMKNNSLNEEHHAVKIRTKNSSLNEEHYAVKIRTKNSFLNEENHAVKIRMKNNSLNEEHHVVKTRMKNNYLYGGYYSCPPWSPKIQLFGNKVSVCFGIYILDMTPKSSMTFFRSLSVSDAKKSRSSCCSGVRSPYERPFLLLVSPAI